MASLIPHVSSIFFFFCLLILSLFLPSANGDLKLIKETCAQTQIYQNDCSKILLSDTDSLNADLPGLILICLKKAKALANSTQCLLGQWLEQTDPPKHDDKTVVSHCYDLWGQVMDELQNEMKDIEASNYISAQHRSIQLSTAVTACNGLFDTNKKVQRRDELENAQFDIDSYTGTADALMEVLLAQTPSKNKHF